MHHHLPLIVQRRHLANMIYFTKVYISLILFPLIPLRYSVSSLLSSSSEASAKKEREPRDNQRVRTEKTRTKHTFYRKIRRKLSNRQSGYDLEATQGSVSCPISEVRFADPPAMSTANCNGSTPAGSGATAQPNTNGVHAANTPSLPTSVPDNADGDQLLLATGGYDHTIKIWQAHTGNCNRTMQHNDSVSEIRKPGIRCCC